MRTRKKRKLAAGRKAGVRKGHWNKRTTSIAYWVLNTVASSRHGRSWVRRNTGRESETYKTWGFLEYSQRIEFMHSFNILFRTSYYTECWVGKDKQMWSYTLKNDQWTEEVRLVNGHLKYSSIISMMKESTGCFRNQTNSNWDYRRFFPRAQDVLKNKKILVFIIYVYLFDPQRIVVEFSQCTKGLRDKTL